MGIESINSGNSSYERIRNKDSHQHRTREDSSSNEDFDRPDDMENDDLDQVSSLSKPQPGLVKTDTGYIRDPKATDPDFYAQDKPDVYTSTAGSLRNNGAPLYSDPIAAREALREQYEKARGITGETVSQENDMSQMSKEDLKSNLDELGIKWSNNGTETGDEAETQAMSTLYNVTMRLPENLRRQFSLEMKDENPDNVGGTTYPNKAKVELFTSNNKTGERFDATTLERNAVHELGHIVDSGMAEGKYNMTGNPEDRYHGLKDAQGVDLFERTQKLEAWAKEKGYNPEQGASLPEGLSEYRQSLMERVGRGELGDITEQEVKLLDNRKWDELGKKDNPNFIYDKYDPHVHSLNYQDEHGKNQEKYARQDKKEYFAETFTTYVLDKGEFQQKMSNMEDYLKNSKPGTDEYTYVRESLSIMRDSYSAMQKLFNE